MRYNNNTAGMRFMPVAFGLAVAVAAALTTPRALAAEVLEFDDVTLFGGTLSYNGVDGVGTLKGTDIKFDTVTGIGTSPSGSLAITGGKLNFETGPNVSEGALFTFSSGGTFVLTGTVLKPDTTVLFSGVILTGHFVGNSIVLGLGGGAGLFSGVGVDSKNPLLLDYFGITPGTPFEYANTEIGFRTSTVSGTGSFTAAVIDADLTNTATDIVPDSGSTLTLMGAGLLGIGAFAWRRRS